MNKQIEDIKALNLLLEDITVDRVLFNSDGEAIDVSTVPAVDSRVTNKLANILYAKGYRKSADVAREIFEEIDKLIYRLLNDVHYIAGDLVWDIKELCKKYESEGEQ